MKIIVTGSRDAMDPYAVERVLDALGPAELSVGCAGGTDAFARQWAERSLGATDWRVYSAEWKRYGVSAGPIRNQAMVDDGADLCIAFPGGRGTKDCTARAQKAGIPVLRVEEL